jgi:hypothetical protein
MRPISLQVVHHVRRKGTLISSNYYHLYYLTGMAHVLTTAMQATNRRLSVVKTIKNGRINSEMIVQNMMQIQDGAKMHNHMPLKQDPNTSVRLTFLQRINVVLVAGVQFHTIVLLVHFAFPKVLLGQDCKPEFQKHQIRRTLRSRGTLLRVQT